MSSGCASCVWIWITTRARPFGSGCSWVVPCPGRRGWQDDRHRRGRAAAALPRRRSRYAGATTPACRRGRPIRAAAGRPRTRRRGKRGRKGRRTPWLMRVGVQLGHPTATRQAVATATAPTETTTRASIHSCFESLPMPSPWNTATAHSPYAIQWTARHVAVAEATAQQAGHDHRDQQVERDGAETQPERPVRRAERHDGVDPPDRREPIDHDGDDVDHDEHDREQRDVAMDALQHEAWRARAATTGRRSGCRGP